MSKPPKPANDPNVQIGIKLRAFYRSVQDEALPQKFLDLLEKLDAVENSAQRAE
ncbi:NepR family anti-sigma factor [Shinella sp.]|uniref:NepR family anti-sigma factor n=1 Tax=Shinella sp. TaxID=1870904 RepID=UPI003C74A5BF